jgi:hypothetical protein
MQSTASRLYRCWPPARSGSLSAFDEMASRTELGNAERRFHHGSKSDEDTRLRSHLAPVRMYAVWLWLRPMLADRVARRGLETHRAAGEHTRSPMSHIIRR